jgi:hypothetical protein
MNRTPSNTASSADVTAAFLAVLPRLARVAAFHFRSVRCPDARADAVGETIALCWAWFARLADDGRHPHAFASALARFAALAVRSGRRLVGYEKAAEVLSPWVQTRHQFAVARLEPTDATGGVGEAVAANTVTPVPDQVQFRCDFPAWRNRLSATRRRVVDLLAVGHRTADVAEAVGVTAGRVSQLRRELAADYAAFCGGDFR